MYLPVSHFRPKVTVLSVIVARGISGFLGLVGFKPKVFVIPLKEVVGIMEHLIQLYVLRS